MISLEGVRVLAVSQYGAGPYGSMHLADLGAEVIKIEDAGVGGDVARTVPPHVREGDSLFYQTFNRNKLGIAINLSSDRGRDIFRRLVKAVDAVYSNLRGDLPQRMGLTYAHLKDANPQIVCCHLTGYGRDGPRAAQPAYDYLIQAEMGLMSLTGNPDGPPERCGLSLIDFMGGITAAFAVTAGILSARMRGIGGDVDVSLLEVGHALLNYLATWHLNEGYVPQRMQDSAHPTLVPSQMFPTADGHIVIMCNKEKFWRDLCEILGADDLASDPRFSDFVSRQQHREEVVSRLKEILTTRTTSEWLELMRERVPAAPVNTVPQALAAARRDGLPVFVEVEHPMWGRILEMATPVRTTEGHRPARRAPSLGEHTQEVLARYAGVSEEEFRSLREEGIV